MSDVGQRLHGTITVTSCLLRRQPTQQLPADDLADLVEEGLQPLLPKRRQKPRSGNAWANLGQTSLQQQTLKSKTHGNNALAPSPWKNTQAGRYVAKSRLSEDSLCYVSVVQKVIRQLRRTGRLVCEAQLVQALREEIFPELNYRSYLNCKSDLAPSTIRVILRGRPTDESFELEQSLTKNYAGQNSAPGMVLTKYPALSPVAVPIKPHSPVQPYICLQPMEWED